MVDKTRWLKGSFFIGTCMSFLRTELTNSKLAHARFVRTRDKHGEEDMYRDRLKSMVQVL